MNESLEARVGAFLRLHSTMTVATIGPEGPWSAAVFYVSDGLDLWWLSKPTARHSLNLESDRRASVTIQEDYRRPGIVQGVQMEGVVTGPVVPAAAVSVMRLYLSKFPPAASDESLPLMSAITAFSASRLYQFVPTRAFFIDSSRGLGHRDEVPIIQRTAVASSGVVS